MNPLEVVVQVGNRRTNPVYLKERFYPVVAGGYGLEIKIDDSSTKVFSAHKFFDRNKSSGRPSVVEVHDHNRKLLDLLTPQTFMHYPKIILCQFPDENGSIISGILPRQDLEISRLRAFNSLAMGYRGHHEVPVVIRTQIHGQN